jgi:hypothetical protein
MIASTSTDVVRVVLAVFGVLMLGRMRRLLLRVRRDPPGEYTTSVIIISLGYGVIGLSAVVAATVRSAAVLWTMVLFTAALPLVRLALRRRHNL